MKFLLTLFALCLVHVLAADSVFDDRGPPARGSTAFFDVVTPIAGAVFMSLVFVVAHYCVK